MSFGQELKDFTGAMQATYKVASDRRDKKEEKRRNAINDEVDNEYKAATTEKIKFGNKWFERIAQSELDTARSANAARDKSTEWADRDNESAIRVRENQIETNKANTLYKFLYGEPDGQARETLQGTAPTGRPTALPVEPASYEGAQLSGDAEAAKALYDVSGELGIDPYDLASTIDYETGGTWNPDIVGGKGGNYAGLIQMGPEERDKYGYKTGMSVGEQLRGPVKNYLADRGLQQGHGLAELYSIINAGSLGSDGKPRLAASDGNGTVADHIRRIGGDHLRNARKRFGAFIVPTQSASNGGLIQHAAVGGMIEENPYEDNERVALPVDAPVPTPKPAMPAQSTEEPVTPAGNDDPKVRGFDVAHKAVVDGINYSLAELGLTDPSAVQDPDSAQKMAEYLKGRGAAPKSIIDQAYQTVDPDNELPESERTMAALGTVYDHYIKQGEPGKAQAAAASIVQYQRKMFQTYSSIAKAAMEGGDIDGGIEAAVRAYSAVPDGKDIKATKTDDGRYAIEFIDEATGKVTSKPILTPEEIGGWAMQVSPGSFDEFILAAAGGREGGDKTPSSDFQRLVTGLDEGIMPTNKDMATLSLEEQREIRQRMKDAGGGEDGAGGGKKVTFEQVNKVRENLDSVWEQMATAPASEGSDELYYKGMAEMPAPDRKVLIDAATDIMTNPRNTGEVNISEQDAIEAAATISQTREFSKKNDKGGVLVTLPDYREVFMPMARFKQLDNIYKRNAKAVGDDVSAAERERLGAVGDAKGARSEMIERRRNAMPPPTSTNGWVDPTMAIPATPGASLPNAWSMPYAIPPEVINREQLDNQTQPAIDRLQELLGL